MFRARVHKVENGKVWVVSANYGSSMAITGPSAYYPFQVGDQVICDTIDGIRDNIVIVSKIAEDITEARYTMVTEGTDLDDLISDGHYMVATDTVAVTVDNLPEDKAGVLRVYRSALGDWVVQEYLVGEVSGRAWSRSYNDSAWSDWARLVTAGEAGDLSDEIEALDGRLDVAEAGISLLSGNLGTVNSQLITTNSTVSTHTSQISTLNTNLSTVSGVVSSHTTRLNAIENFTNADRTWSINLASAWVSDPTITTPQDVTGLSLSLPATAGSTYMIVVTLNVEAVASHNSALHCDVVINGTVQPEKLIYRTPSLGNPTTGSRTNMSQTYFWSTLSSGPRLIKVRAWQHATTTTANYRLSANDSNIRIVRVV